MDAFLIPRPTNYKKVEGSFYLSADTTIISPPNSAGIAQLLGRNLANIFGYDLSILNQAGEEEQTSSISFRYDIKDNDHPESYRIEITPNQILISASDLSGLSRGAQCLWQMILGRSTLDQNTHQGGIQLPGAVIQDIPRFSWRGLHLDVSRHYFPVDFIKRFLDLMYLYRLNRFHWHLTDDQGWRIEIKKYPKLTEIGSKRSSTPILTNKNQDDGVPYGGYYNQDEIREVVSYASERYITVIPEIEMPGHCQAALAAYPQYGCLDKTYQVGTKWGMQEDVFCAGNDSLYVFLEEVLQEVFELFPAGYIHIGGDECPKSRWKECPLCQKRIKGEDLKNEDELQSYFIHRVADFIQKNGKRVIGWDEIIEGGLAPNVVVMSWRGSTGGVEAAKATHDVVMTPNTHCYFDYYQSRDVNSEPPAIGGFIPLETVFSFDPLNDVPNDKHHHILGGQGNIWTEYISSPTQVEYMAFPRTLALAEVLWSGPNGDYEDFRNRVATHQGILDIFDVNYRPLD